MIRRVAFALLAGGCLSSLAEAQTPPPTAPAPSATPSQAASAPAAAKAADPSRPQPPAADANARKPLFDPVPTDPNHPAYHAGAHRTIVRHNPLPRRASYASSGGQSRQSGFSDGGVGRFNEYYDSNTLAAPVDNHPVAVGRFDTNSDTNRSEQLSAFQEGNQRAGVTQNTINTYGRPYGAYGAGFGYGLGLAGGGLYSYPN